MSSTPRMLLAAGVLAATLVSAPADAATPQCHGVDATIVGTDKKDDLVGTSDADVVVLGTGDDRFDGLGGNDLICGGPGDDTITGGDGDDRVYGQLGDDTIIETVTHDLTAADLDNVAGGLGQDRIDYSTSLDPVKVWDGHAYYNGRPGMLRVQAKLHGFETYVGSPGTDEIRAGRYASTLIGSGSDKLIGSGGRDTIIASDNVFADGNGGRDTITATGTADVKGGDGDDTLYVGDQAHARGSHGDDTLIPLPSANGATLVGKFDYNLIDFSQVGKRVTVDGELGTASWNGGSITFKDFQWFRGGSHDDLISGTSGADRIFGGKGNDRLYGLGGDDFVSGGKGKDHVYGGEGTDRCAAEVRRSCERRL